MLKTIFTKTLPHSKMRDNVIGINIIYITYHIIIINLKTTFYLENNS